ncbi:MAG: replicative DNA helicase [Rhizorhabdus sp.]|uniref:replicative DNA helicase n=1 Tax=Rhizorhabdus sp. TaxID=1968843 RepID=UPI001B74FDFE|nr:replicative DNA helicase [Rhizorhabdus sp.]MBP8234307.1 replicative DNA helicase [Rhizorhabdus sp.]
METPLSIGPGAGDHLYRRQPHNIEAEQALLGAILTNNEALARVQGFLLAEHFFNLAHQRVYRAAAKVVERGQIANPVTLKTLFDRDEALQELGGASYLARLAGAAITIINVVEYGRLIHDLAVRRELIRVGEEMVNNAYDAALEVAANRQIEQAEAKLFALAETGRSDRGFVSFKESIRQSLERAEAALGSGGVSGITCGMADVDRMLGGFHSSDLLILAGRPSMGKTALATTMAFNAARICQETGGRAGAGVAFFSLEMSADQLATRILAMQAEIPSEKFRKGDMTDDEFQARLIPAAQLVEQIPFFIDDTGAIPIPTLRARARRLKRQHPEIGLIVVDYLQLVRGSSSRGNENRVQEVSEVTQGLKALAKELDVPVLALSQLSRQVEQREDKRPQLSDLRESGSIEQDADVVMFVYREEYYEMRKQPAMGTPEHVIWQENMDRISGQAELVIGKQRHGPIGNVVMRFESQFTKFSDYDAGGR